MIPKTVYLQYILRLIIMTYVLHVYLCLCMNMYVHVCICIVDVRPTKVEI